ncbi:MAG: 2-succinyl-5-enolpyruvyl-6-hydroxy-3-cyclohexene-1-carboxylic-acid synthase [Actinomycetota bacterium]|nr:2-succinyl-5-enolpyruvyl-6-hydroxy-3-cyclohexene-1-carboxylic-acid synthase [Actinomycetota bacterium]
MTSAGAVQAAFAATMVDEWARAGVRHAVVSPGSRSAPLAIALAADPRMRLHVFLDERSAGFCALGIGKATGIPAVVLTTSGTAAVELHPAVVEASQARVSMLVCTADRPPELRGVGAPQTVDQTRLYGSAVRWFCEPGVAEVATMSTWRSLASRAVAEAMLVPAGPVHLNLAFREPLVADPGPIPAPRPSGAPWHQATPPARLAGAPGVEGLLGAERGVIVAGAGAGDPEAVHALARERGWPVLADPPSGCRVPAATTVAAFDALLRHRPLAETQVPEVVVRLGAAPASKVLAGWLAGSGAHQVLVDPERAWIDPQRSAAVVVPADPTVWCRTLAATGGAGSGAWLASWAEAEAVAQQAMDTALAGHPEVTEPGLARCLVGTLAPGATLVVSSSMPVRDVEWYAAARDDVRVLANRGANGIDGVTSTAVGVALGSDAPSALLVGDLAFLHDTNGLLGLAGRAVDLTIVVVDNGGGGIFSFLPPARALEAERFELLFGTPQGVDLVALARLYGLAADPVDDLAALEAALHQAVRSGGGVKVLVATTERAANVAIHDEIHAEVAAALARLP